MGWKSVLIRQTDDKLSTMYCDTYKHASRTISCNHSPGAMISDKGSKAEIMARIADTTTALARLKPIWRDKNKNRLKPRLMYALVISIISIFFYAYKSWTLIADLEKILALEMQCI